MTDLDQELAAIIERSERDVIPAYEKVKNAHPFVIVRKAVAEARVALAGDDEERKRGYLRLLQQYERLKPTFVEPIDTSKCMELRDAPPTSGSFIETLRKLGGPRCQAPATHDSVFGRRCAPCAEKLRQALRSPNTLGNILADGRPRTEDEIARMVKELPS